VLTATVAEGLHARVCCGREEVHVARDGQQIEAPLNRAQGVGWSGGVQTGPNAGAVGTTEQALDRLDQLRLFAIHAGRIACTCQAQREVGRTDSHELIGNPHE
jgi:hypothetical protein